MRRQEQMGHRRSGKARGVMREGRGGGRAGAGKRGGGAVADAGLGEAKRPRSSIMKKTKKQVD